MGNTIDKIKAQADIYTIAEWGGLKVEDKNKPYQLILCPFHPDTKPSLSLFKTKGIFNCFSCKKRGDLITLYCLLKKIDIKTAIKDLTEKLGIQRDLIPRKTKPVYHKAITTLESRVEQYHQGLLQNEYALKLFQDKRRLDLDYIKAKKIGYSAYNEAFSIPIYDESGNVVNIRYHKTSSKDKWVTKGHTVKLLYDLTSYNQKADYVWICEGEGDFWTMEHLLKLNAITSIGGAESLPDLVQNNFKYFTNKEIYLILDNDRAGNDTTAKLRLLFNENTKVYRIDWKGFPEKFDVSDFVIRNGKKLEDLKALIKPYSLREAREYLDIEQQKKEAMRDEHNPIREINGVYVRMIGDSKDFERISSFLIKGKAFVEVKESPTHISEGWLKADIINYNGLKEENILFNPQAFISKQSLLKTINNPSFVFKGADKDVQHIIERVMADKNIVRKEGTKSIGFYKNYFVFPGGCIGKNGMIEDPPIEYINQGLLLDDLMVLRTDGFEEIIKKFAENIVFLNDIELILPSLGWFISCYYKEMIKNTIGYFPIMTYFGVSGSGKTSLAILLWKLFGIKSSELLSAHSTRFTVIRTLSSTKVVPIIIDEFKKDIGIDKINFWKQMIRSTYFGEIEMRGKMDLSITKYRYESPLMIVGEMSVVKEVAIADRTIQLTFDKSYIQNHAECKESFYTIKSIPLETFMPYFVIWVLNGEIQTFPNHWQEAKEELYSFQLPKVSDRVLDNLIVIIFGIRTMERFLKYYDLGLLINRDDIRKSLSRIIGEIMTVKDRTKNAFDELIESIGILIKDDKLRSSKEYKIEEDKLFIHLNGCVPIFKKWAREHSFDGEILDRKEYFNMAKEMLGGYVKKLNVVKRFGDTIYRTIEIDLREAENTGLDISGYGVTSTSEDYQEKFEGQ